MPRGAFSFDAADAAMALPTLQTERLVLRATRDDYPQRLAAMKAAERVMRHYPATLSRDESGALLSAGVGV